MSKARKFLTGGVLSLLYPIGCVFISVEDTDICPLEVVGVGKWEKIAENRVLQGSSETHLAGEELEAGLPNLSGLLNIWKAGEQIYSKTGVFAASWAANATYGAHSGSTTQANLGIEFRANSSNSIYGKSTTVQPPALVVSIWKRVS